VTDQSAANYAKLWVATWTCSSFFNVIWVLVCVHVKKEAYFILVYFSVELSVIWVNLSVCSCEKGSIFNFSLFLRRAEFSSKPRHSTWFQKYIL